MRTIFTVSWGTGSRPVQLAGTFNTIWPLEAFGKYHKLNAPYKKLVMTDQEHGDRTLLTSRGEDNLDKYHVRNLFNLTIRRK